MSIIKQELAYTMASVKFAQSLDGQEFAFADFLKGCFCAFGIHARLASHIYLDTGVGSNTLYGLIEKLQIERNNPVRTGEWGSKLWSNMPRQVACMRG